MRSTDPGTLRTVDIWTFKSSKSNKHCYYYTALDRKNSAD